MIHFDDDELSDASFGVEADDECAEILPSVSVEPPEQPEDVHVDESDLDSVKNRIETICGLLENLKTLKGDRQIRRKALISELGRLATIYYGYSDELVEYFLKLLNPVEAMLFFEANERPLPTTIRANTLKTKRRDLAAALIARGANVDPTGPWTKEGLVVHASQVPIGATPEYLAGHYMLQSAASLVPVLALSPQPGEKVLDIAAAPGGKATHIAQLMNNTGVLFANDVSKERCQALVANIHRLGVSNAIVSNYSGLDLVGVLPPLDRVLCDAPCSGLGIVSRDPMVKVKRTLVDIRHSADMQKKLLLACIDMVNDKTGGVIVYSTCSVSIEENEEVINYVLGKRNVKLVPLGLDVGSPAISSFRGKQYNPAISEHARRFYPHVHKLDGFFVAKLKKLPGSRKRPRPT